jgi:hypothetical protein
MTIRGRVARRSTLSTPKSCQHWGELWHSAHSLSGAVGRLYPTVIRHLQGSLGTKNFYLCWVPYELTPNLRRRLLDICARLLPILGARRLDSFCMLITSGKSWSVLECQHSTKRSVAPDEISTRVSQTIRRKKPS